MIEWIIYFELALNQLINPRHIKHTMIPQNQSAVDAMIDKRCLNIGESVMS